MPPEEYRGNVRWMLYESIFESPDQLAWALGSDERAAKESLPELDLLIEEDGQYVREQLEKEGITMHEVTDLTLGWIAILYDFTRSDESSMYELIDDMSLENNEA